MKIKSLHTHVLSCALLFFVGVSGISASPLVTIGEDTALYFVGTASVSSDSNVAYSNENELDDIIIEVAPGFELVGGNAQTGASFSVTGEYALRRYMDYDEFDSELPAIAAEARFLSPKSTTEVSASYIETLAENRRAAAPGLVLKSGITSFGLNTDADVTAKTAVVGGVRYSDTERKTFGSDFTDVSVPVNFYYGATEKLDLGVGYRYRNTSVDNSTLGDRDSHFFNVALRGELSPKLVADLKLGLQKTEIDGGEEVDGFGLDGTLSYFASEKATVDVILSRDDIVGFAGDVISNTSASVVGSYSFNPSIIGSASFTTGNDSYETSTRDDDYTILGLSATYAPTSFMSLIGSFNYVENDSSLDLASFKKNTFKFSVNIRY